MTQSLSSTQRPVVERLVELCCVVLIGLALGGAQVLIGGTRLLFSLPAYALLGLSAVATLLIVRRPRPAADRFCLPAAALFFGYILARAVVSPVEYVARPDIYSVLGGLLVYLLTACFVTAAKPRLTLLLALLALAMVHVLIGAL